MKYTVRQVFNQFSDNFLDKYTLSYEQNKVFNRIIQCRTKDMGMRVYKCETCGHKIFTYNSCKDRHCPSCQNYKKEVWIEKNKQNILNVPYFHIVMTVPAKLRVIFYHNQEKMYSILFKAAAETIQELALSDKYLGAQVGITAMLHTWTQQAAYHPHVHMIVTGGGINKLGEWVEAKEDFFLPVKVISKKFRGKILSMIKEEELKFYGEYEYLNNERELKKYLESMYNKEWVCYCKEPFNNVNSVYEYLGRYAFKVCMSDERITNITETDVYFNYRDRKHNNEIKEMHVKGEEFIRRFLLHTLPTSFMKIRHYGLFAGKGKNKRMKKLQAITKTHKSKKTFLSKLELINKMVGRDITKCPKCGGQLVLIEEIGREKPPDLLLQLG